MALRPTLRELAETYRADLNGGSYSVDMIPTTQVVEKEIIRLRAIAIRQVFMPTELELKLNGRDDYGLMFYTLTGTSTATGYPTFLIIFERLENDIGILCYRTRH